MCSVRLNPTGVLHLSQIFDVTIKKRDYDTKILFMMQNTCRLSATSTGHVDIGLILLSPIFSECVGFVFDWGASKVQVFRAGADVAPDPINVAGAVFSHRYGRSFHECRYYEVFRCISTVDCIFLFVHLLR